MCYPSLLAVASLVIYVNASATLPASIFARRQGHASAHACGQPDAPAVDSKALQASIQQTALSDKAKELEKAAYSTSQRNRVLGSEGLNNTFGLIEHYLESVSHYYDHRRQEFQVPLFQGSGNFSADGTDYAATVYQYSPPTPARGIDAPVVVVPHGGCSASDYPAKVAGTIALISREMCPFDRKSELAGAAGALGAVVYNNAPGPYTGKLDPYGKKFIPTVGITKEKGAALLDMINRGKTVKAHLQIDSVKEIRTTYNIIADTKCGDKNNVLVLGAHADSVYAGPGINDDGSGMIALLETALQLAKYSTKNAVRFCFWSAEEFGALGSQHYVSQINHTSEADKIKLYLNFDMIASPNYVYAILDGDGSAFKEGGPPGSAEVEHFLADWFKGQGLPTKETLFHEKSDIGAFVDIGIPAGGLFTGASDLKTKEEAAIFGGEAGVAYDVNYHQAGDNYKNLNFKAFLTNTKAIAAAIAYYSTSFDSLPPRQHAHKR